MMYWQPKSMGSINLRDFLAASGAAVSHSPMSAFASGTTADPKFWFDYFERELIVPTALDHEVVAGDF